MARRDSMVERTMAAMLVELCPLLSIVVSAEDGIGVATVLDRLETEFAVLGGPDRKGVPVGGCCVAVGIVVNCPKLAVVVTEPCGAADAEVETDDGWAEGPAMVRPGVRG
jgi:hypothetical protein